jgi:TPR repeat protein
LNNNTVTFRIPVARRPVERPQQQDDTNERVWSALRTEFLAPPAQKGWGVPGFAMVAGAVGAVVVSAATAFVVVYMLNLSSPLATASRDDEATRNQSFSAAAANLSMVAAAQAKMQPADEPPAPTGALLAATAPSEDAAATKSPAQLPSPSPEIKNSPEPRAVASLPPAAAAPPAASSPPPVAVSPPPAAAAPPAPASAPPAAASAPPVPAPAPQPTLAISQDEITALLKRGRDLIAAGDVASARLVLTHLADSGVAEASFVLATTFDPAVLETLRVVGMKADPAKAKAWYSRAADQGSQEAKQRLQALR